MISLRRLRERLLQEDLTEWNRQSIFRIYSRLLNGEKTFYNSKSKKILDRILKEEE